MEEDGEKCEDMRPSDLDMKSMSRKGKGAHCIVTNQGGESLIEKKHKGHITSSCQIALLKGEKATVKFVIPIAGLEPR